MALVHKGIARHGMAYATLQQTEGKGQRGKTWHTQPGKSIALSLIIRADKLNIGQPFLLSMAVALGSYNFLKKYAGAEIKIKWPNDLYWRDRKAGGILIENAFNGTKWKWAVVGIGININQTRFNKDLSSAISLQQITTREYDVVKLTEELYEAVLQQVEKLENITPETLHKQYNRKLYKCSDTVKLKKGPATFTTTVMGVSLYGQLLTKDVMERQFDFGEVEWLL